MAAYYNEIDGAAAHVIECLIKDRVIAGGVVDRRSIVDVEPSDVRDFAQCHFFAGGGLWSIALRLAGWPDDRPVWTGSCPCQPFSQAGKRLGRDDPRHLWPDFHRLIAGARPDVVFGEQVAGAAGYDWFDGVAADLERENYACEAFDIPAAAVDAPHIRQRLYWVAMANAENERLEWGGPPWRRRNGFEDDSCGMEHAESERRGERRAKHEVWRGRRSASGSSSLDMANAELSERGPRPEGRGYVVDWQDTGRQETASRRELDCEANDCGIGDANSARLEGRESMPECRSERFAGPPSLSESFWSDYEWRTGAGGKARRVKPGLRLLVDGLPGRVGLLRIAGNAIVPQLAAEVIKAVMETVEPSE